MVRGGGYRGGCECPLAGCGEARSVKRDAGRTWPSGTPVGLPLALLITLTIWCCEARVKWRKHRELRAVGPQCALVTQDRGCLGMLGGTVPLGRLAGDPEAGLDRRESLSGKDAAEALVLAGTSPTAPQSGPARAAPAGPARWGR